MPACYSLLFFFSSRRRHTRYIGDWSSDVCSSDLLLGPFITVVFTLKRLSLECEDHGNDCRYLDRLAAEQRWPVAPRSEERRVGKERRDGGGAGHDETTEQEDGQRAKSRAQESAEA